jgi:hypothetical protein
LSSKNIKYNLNNLETTSVCASSVGLHGFWLLVWFLKKVYKFLRKSLKEFDLNLKRKMV